MDEEIIDFLEPVMTTADRQNHEESKERINSLVVALYFIVLSRRRSPSSGSSVQQKKMDKKTFSEMRQTALISLGLPPSARKHRDDVDQWIALIMELGWANGREWFENVPTEDGPEEEQDVVAEDDSRERVTTEALLSEDGSAGLLPGLGSMMQDRVNFLNQDRKEDYMLWKTGIMARIKKLEGKGKVAVQ